MRKPTEYEVEQNILLGGQVSQKHQEFQELAKYGPSMALPIWIMKNQEELFKKSLEELTLDVLTVMGELEFLRVETSELTKLSMILGDTRKHFSMKKGIDELRATKPDSEP